MQMSISRHVTFTEDEINQLIAGRKTQFRRAIKPRPPTDYVAAMVAEEDPPCSGNLTGKVSWCLRDQSKFDFPRSESDWLSLECPYGKTGDKLLVKERYMLDPPIDGTWPSLGDTYIEVDDIPEKYRTPEHVIYKAACTLHNPEAWNWRSAPTMPKWASRFILKIETVRFERLHDISVLDIDAEGYPHAPTKRTQHQPGPVGLMWFENQWNERYGQVKKGSKFYEEGYTFQDNPWVWAVTFTTQRLDKVS